MNSLDFFFVTKILNWKTHLAKVGPTARILYWSFSKCRFNQKICFFIVLAGKMRKQNEIKTRGNFLNISDDTHNLLHMVFVVDCCYKRWIVGEKLELCGPFCCCHTQTRSHRKRFSDQRRIDEILCYRTSIVLIRLICMKIL